MPGLLHRYWFSIHHHKYAVRDITEGGRDSAERMMKRRAMEEKTEQWWKYSREGKVKIRHVAKMSCEASQFLST